MSERRDRRAERDQVKRKVGKFPGPETGQLGDHAEGDRPQPPDPAGSAAEQTHLCQAACRFLVSVRGQVFIHPSADSDELKQTSLQQFAKPHAELPVKSP